MPTSTVTDWQALASSLAAAGIDAPDTQPRPVAGGDIAAAWRLELADGPVFLKTMPASQSSVLEGEAEGLKAIAASNTVTTPRVVGMGATASEAWLALEWLDLCSLGRNGERLLGERLAAMHRSTADRFGWHRDNTIGRTPQPNPWSDDWVGFFREHRLRHQLKLAAQKGFHGRLQADGERLCESLPALFEDYEPAASLLHGDLWGGNAAEVAGEPVIFDPAVYYGDRESDIAMTRLFGGYGSAFYEAYNEAWPLDDGYALREKLYQLYHVLNHLNLFGGGYAGRAEALTRELLARV